MHTVRQIRGAGHGSSHVEADGESSGLHSELISALSGRDANRERTTANRTRRVVMSSLGVQREQRQGGSRSRAVALAIALVVLVMIAPLIWEATDSLIAGEHLADPGSQLSIWACIVCPTILGAALIAGWWRKRS